MGDSSEKLRSITTSLQRLIECQICLDTIKVPFKICTTGHLICTECIHNLDRCPTCQEAFTLENPVCVKKFLEAVPLFCKYSENGCRDIVEFGDNHETFCGFRLVSCKELLCKDKVSASEIQKHYATKHSAKKVFDAENTVASPEFNLKSKELFVTPVWLFNSFAWMNRINNVDERYLKIVFHVATVGKPLGDYFLCISFEKEKVKYTSTIKATLIGSDDKLYSDANTANDDIANALASDDPQFCMKVPHGAISNFIKYGELLWKFEAFMLPNKS